ncbi:hypothetical protein IAT38_002367 [Cryptococcus sp. DSM 104549]
MSDTNEKLASTAPTTAELWAGWEAWETLPLEIQDHIDDYRTPADTATRLTWEDHPPGLAADLHSLRLFKVNTWKTIHNKATEEGSGETFTKLWDSFKTQDVGESTLKEKLAKVEKERAGADIDYLQGRYLPAMLGYIQAWSNVLPWHTHALSPTDPLRRKLGQLEADMFMRMSDACYALSGITGEREYLYLAHKCAWVAFEEREHASVVVIWNACAKAENLLRLTYANDTAKRTAVQEMLDWYEEQGDALEDAPNDRAYGDLSEEYRVTLPSRRTMQMLGPREWARKWIEARSIEKSGKPAKGDTKPRDLSSDELWAAWKPLSEEMRAGISNYTPSSTYPIQRTTYFPLSPGNIGDLHSLRTAKLEIFREVMYGEDAEGDEQTFKGDWQAMREGTVDSWLLEGKLDEVDRKKDGANRHFRDENYRKASVEYLAAWGLLLPYYPEALPPSPLRSRLSKTEAALWGNLAASLIAWAKEVPSQRRGVYLDAAFKCAWAAWEERDAASASVIRNSCRRAKDTFTPSRNIPSNDSLPLDIASMERYWTDQTAALEGLAKDTLFQEVEAVRKVPAPENAVLRKFGPHQWALDRAYKEGMETLAPLFN